jgi:hypothetical protein
MEHGPQYFAIIVSKSTKLIKINSSSLGNFIALYIRKERDLIAGLYLVLYSK